MPGGTLEHAGLIDLQVNGYRGHDLNGPDVDAATVLALTRALWHRGTTTYLGTVITAPEEGMVRSLQAIAEARRRDALVAHSLAGVHVEGPFISAAPGARGAHDPTSVRAPDVAELDRWQDAAEGAVRMVTVAPELPGAIDFIRAARDRGVLISIGHSAASADDVRAAVAAGATLSTHLGNGVELMLPRHPNLIWAQLAEDALGAMVILDGHHLDDDVAIVILRAKGQERVVLTSDSAALAGMPAGTHRTPVGGQVEVAEDGRLSLRGTGLLAGSGRALLDCIDWASGALPWTREALVRCATVNPAAIIGVADRVQDDGDRIVLDVREGRSAVRVVRVAGEQVVTPH